MGRLTSLPSAVITDDSALGGAVIEKSLRFNDNDSAYLSRTPSTDGNRKTYTISAWVRRSTNGSTHPIFSRYTANSDSGFLGLYLNSDNYIYFTGWNTVYVKSNRLYRDTNSWAHIVLAVDTTQGNASDRIKLYFNGELLTLATYNAPSQNADLRINEASAEHMIGRYSSSYFDGYMAEVNFVDGFQLTPSSFGYTEFQTGIWRPKGYFGSYGTNGFRLDFSDNSGTTAVTLGKDRSGQGNDYTPTNLSVSAGVGNDSFLESPTTKKEFPTFNSNLQTSSSTEYRQGNLAFYTSGSSTVQTRANMSRNSGKWYAEFTLTTYTFRSGSYPYIGVAQAENFSNTWVGQSGTAYNGNGHIYRNGSQLETGHATYTQGDVISVAINLDSSPPQVWWAKNGTYIRSGNPSTLTAGVNIEPASTSGTYTFTASLYANPGQWDANFGQRAFAYSVPTGFKTLNTDNFSINTPSILRPQKHFDVLTYAGNNGTNVVTGLEFRPDLVWIKNRSTTSDHLLMDCVRGPNNIRSNGTVAEQTNTNVHLQTFNPNGFTVIGTGSNSNSNGHNFVAWCWKAGTPIVPTSGSIFADGTTDYLTVGGHSDLDFGTGDFTIEGFFNTHKKSNSTIICSNNYYTAGTNGNWLFRITNNGSFGFATYDGTSNEEYSEFSFTYSMHRWYHFAIVREGTGSNQLKVYIDGNSIGAMTVSKSLSGGTTGVGIGEDLSGTNGEFQGYLSNIRIIKGTALYTSNFTAPTSPLTNVTNTKLLCCQSESSATAATVAPTSITASGNVRSDIRNPFDAYSIDGVGYPNAAAAGLNTGTITPTQASVNKETGFSVVIFTGTGSAGTISHGLGKAPSWVITKRLDASQAWFTHHRSLSNGHYLRLNGTNQQGGDTNVYPNNMSTTNTFAVGGDDGVNGNGSTYVSYCWAEIPGYSKFGVYLGNASTDGPYVELGFRPAFVMTKSKDGINENWCISDSTRSTSNSVNLFLRPDESTSDSSGAAQMDFLAKGFKLRTSDTKTNRTGTNYVYMAFAEQPGESPYHTDTNAR